MIQVPVFEGLLSPIDLRESDPNVCDKLDQLYKSYEKKEKMFGGDDEVEYVKETPLRKVNDFFK